MAKKKSLGHPAAVAESVASMTAREESESFHCRISPVRECLPGAVVVLACCGAKPLRGQAPGGLARETAQSVSVSLSQSRPQRRAIEFDYWVD